MNQPRALRSLAASLLVLASVLLLPARDARAQEDTKRAPSCGYCGMDRGKFASSRMLIEYDDGSAAGLCSIHCAAIELAVSIDKTIKTIQVADMGTGKLLDAEKAVWVIGGGKPGVMSRRAKWAFADKAAAEAFVKAGGGAIGTFEDALKATYEDLYQDTKMIRERRKMMKARGRAAEPAHAH